MDQDIAFISSLMNYLFRKLDMKIKTVVPYNHQSIQAEHGIKDLAVTLMDTPWYFLLILYFLILTIFFLEPYSYMS